MTITVLKDSQCSLVLAEAKTPSKAKPKARKASLVEPIIASYQPAPSPSLHRSIVATNLLVDKTRPLAKEATLARSRPQTGSPGGAGGRRRSYIDSASSPLSPPPPAITTNLCMPQSCAARALPSFLKSAETSLSLSKVC